MKQRLVGWIKGHIPTRESLEANRWVRPFSHRVMRSELWRMNRRKLEAEALRDSLIAAMPQREIVDAAEHLETDEIAGE